jgi:hypothetical protein
MIFSCVRRCARVPLPGATLTRPCLPGARMCAWGTPARSDARREVAEVCVPWLLCRARRGGPRRLCRSGGCIGDHVCRGAAHAPVRAPAAPRGTYTGAADRRGRRMPCCAQRLMFVSAIHGPVAGGRGWGALSCVLSIVAPPRAPRSALLTANQAPAVCPFPCGCLSTPCCGPWLQAV